MDGFIQVGFWKFAIIEEVGTSPCFFVLNGLKLFQYGYMDIVILNKMDYLAKCCTNVSSMDTWCIDMDYFDIKSLWVLVLNNCTNPCFG